MKGRDIQNLQSFEKTQNMAYNRRFNNYRTAEPTQLMSSEQAVQLLSDTNTAVPYVPSNRPTVVVLDNSSKVVDAVAKFNLTIDRKTANIDAVLPVPVFGALDYESEYTDVITPYLPAGCTYAITRTTDKKGLIITYTAGANIDAVHITVKEKPYLSLLRGTQGSVIRLSQIKAKIFDTLDQEQFSEQIRPVFNSLFGLSTSNPFTADDSLRDDQFIETMRTINQEITVDAETTIIFGMSAIADNVLVLTTSVSRFSTERG